MKEWLIRLKGENFDLQELPKLLALPDMIVVEEEGTYYLKSTKFDSLTDASEVLAVATHILDIVNGVAKLNFGNFQSVEVDHVSRVDEYGKRHHYVFLAGIAKGRGRVSAALTVIKADGTVDSSQHPTHAESWIEIAKKEELVERALVLYGSLEHNWRNLYMVLEGLRIASVARGRS